MDSLKESPIMQTRSIYKTVAPQFQDIPETFTKQIREDIIGKGRKGSQDEQYQVGALENNCGVKVEKINSYLGFNAINKIQIISKDSSFEIKKKKIILNENILKKINEIKNKNLKEIFLKLNK